MKTVDKNLTHDIIKFLSQLSEYELGLIDEIKNRAWNEGNNITKN